MPCSTEPLRLQIPRGGVHLAQGAEKENAAVVNKAELEHAAKDQGCKRQSQLTSTDSTFIGAIFVASAIILAVSLWKSR